MRFYDRDPHTRQYHDPATVEMLVKVLCGLHERISRVENEFSRKITKLKSDFKKASDKLHELQTAGQPE